MCDGLNREAIESQGTMEHIGAGPTMFQTLFDSRFDVQSRETLPDGSVNLKAVQTVLFNPAGVESALRPAMYATMNQLVTLRKGAEGWKVASFKNDFVSMGSYRP